MNKGDLVNEVAKGVNTKKEAQAAVDSIKNNAEDHGRKPVGESVPFVPPHGGG